MLGCKTEERNSQREQGRQWSKQEACFARETRVWLAIKHNTSVTSGEWVRWSKRIAWESALGSCQLNSCNLWGYEGLQKSKDSLKVCFENVNIQQWTHCVHVSDCIHVLWQVQQKDKHVHLRALFFWYNVGSFVKVLVDSILNFKD